MAHDDIEPVAMHHQVALAVCGFVKGLLDHLDAAEMMSREIAQELVVIAWNIDNPRSLAGLTQQLLDDIIVTLGPVPAGFKPPGVDDIADEIDGLGIMPT